MSSRILWLGVVMVILAVSHLATAAEYCHDFTSLRDLTVNNSAQLRIGPAPGGKLGPVLQIWNSGPLH